MDLLVRSTRRVTLTQTGREFPPRVQHLLNELDESLLGISDIGALRRGVVTLACIPTVAYYFMPATLVAFAQRLPDLRVRIMDLSAEAVTDAVAAGVAEFGIGMPTTARAEIEFKTLRADPFVAVFRHDHRLAAKRGALRWSDLDGESLVGVSRRSGNRLILERALLPRGMRPTWRYETEHLHTSLGLAEAGLGITVVPRLALPRGEHPVLLVRQLVDPAIERPTGLILRRGYLPTPAAQALIALLSEELAKTPKPDPS